MAATKSSGEKASGTAKKATKAKKGTKAAAGASDKLTLSKETLQDLQSLVREAARPRQSRKVCVAAF
jgi:hypothetical protein